MKIAIYGSGGVGGYFGALLAKGGHEVTFIARGDHLRAIQNRGLQVISVNGDFSVHPAKAVEDPIKVGPVDYVIVAVKHYHLRAVAPKIRSLLGSHTTVVPLLNGVDAHEILIESLGDESIVGGLCSLVSMVEAPGVIRQPTRLQRVVVGELDHTKSLRVEKIVQAWHDCGAEALHAEDIHAAMWTKFCFIASFGGVSALARVNIGEMMACKPTRELYREAIWEAVSLARAQNVPLEPGFVQRTIEFTESFEPTATSSMQRDVASGKLFELEAFSGKIFRLGRDLGIPTPVHRAIYALLKPALQRATQ
jgi:2-dehydropantoate 2-reductase